MAPSETGAEPDGQPRRPSGWGCELAEALGAFVIVLVGCGAIVSLRSPESLATLPVAMAFGGAVAVSVYSLAHISGAHFNPAVTVAFAAISRFPLRRVPTYVAAQLAGATAAAALVAWALAPAGTVGATTLARGVTFERAVALEAAFTFLLMFVIVATATDTRAPRGVAGLSIGAAVSLGSLAAGYSTGASLNPARSFGPALLTGVWDNFGVYIIGPLIGAVAAALVYEAMRGFAPPPPPGQGAGPK